MKNTPNIEVRSLIQTVLDTYTCVSMHTHTHHTGMATMSYIDRVSGEVRDTL